MTQLMVLHWGQVTQNINVSGVDATSGVAEAATKSGKSIASKARGRGKVASASGKTTPAAGSC